MDIYESIFQFFLVCFLGTSGRFSGGSCILGALFDHCRYFSMTASAFKQAQSVSYISCLSFASCKGGGFVVDSLFVVSPVVFSLHFSCFWYLCFAEFLEGFGSHFGLQTRSQLNRKTCEIMEREAR